MIYIAVTIAFILVSALYCFLYFRHIEPDPETKYKNFYNIEDCPNNKYSMIKGTVELLPDSCTSPLYEKQCASYISSVYKRYKSRGITTWLLQFQEKNRTSFLVRQGEYYALVNPENSTVKLKYLPSVHNPRDGCKNDSFRRFMKKYDYSEKSIFGYKHLRFNEDRLDENDEVIVKGIGTWIPVREIEGLNPLDFKKQHIYVIHKDSPKLIISNDL